MSACRIIVSCCSLYYVYGRQPLAYAGRWLRLASHSWQPPRLMATLRHSSEASYGYAAWRRSPVWLGWLPRLRSLAAAAVNVAATATPGYARKSAGLVTF